MTFRQVIGRRITLLPTLQQQPIAKRCFSSLVVGYSVNSSLLDRRRHYSLTKVIQSPIRSSYFHPGIRLLSTTSSLFDIKKNDPIPSSSVESTSPQTSESGKVGPILEDYEPQKLSEDILTIPNVLTIMRLLSTPVLGYLVLIDEMQYALGLLAVSGFTDLLDGYLARKFGSATVFGSIADPAADKALMTVMVGVLAWRGLIPIPLVLLIIGRDVGLVLSAFLIRWKSLPEPKTFQRYWDPRLPSAKVKPTQISKYNTFLQIILVGICTLLASMSDPWRTWWSEREGLWEDKSTLPVGEGRESTTENILTNEKRDQWGNLAKKVWHSFMLLVATTTAWSGASYMFGTGAVQNVGKIARQRVSAASKTGTK
ncbi:uncharacterized protein FA14DRAFT_161911 [Meira miltonrushii]|uniref:CDP-alcohol phosphatidyltransferase n=1 Tax=Meira miltonrushii TaxID=1280837 RepID=A0A316V8I5_9BASI|nr:uncharacterized protein FA14DRAFT_161911 [Meira miltonrushii]PWN32503.1 hypothetical protein FA14DRAFT_161911 [Meira miltonrushii]